MKTLRLPETSAERINIMCVRADGTTYFIETKRCATIQVPDDVVKAVVTPLPGRLALRDNVDFSVV